MEGCCYVDGNLYTCGNDNTIKMLDPDGTLTHLNDINNPTCIAYANNNIWVGTADKMVFNLSTNKGILCSGPVTALAGDDLRLFVAIGNGKVVELINDGLGQQLVDSPITAMAVDGQYLCVSTVAGELKEFDTDQHDWRVNVRRYNLTEYGDSKPLYILHIKINIKNQKHTISLSTREEATTYVPLSPTNAS